MGLISNRLSSKTFTSVFCGLFAVLFSALFSSPVSADKVLYIGDSLSVSTGGFGPAMYNDIVDEGHQVDFYALCGASPRSWQSDEPKSTCGYWHKSTSGAEVVVPWPEKSTAPSFQETLQDSDPDRVVIQLGTNMLTGDYFRHKNDLMKEIESMLDAVGNRQCLWIGPPDAADYKISPKQRDEFYLALEEAAQGRCEIVDGRKDTEGKAHYYPEGVKDGLHFYREPTKATERKWRDAALAGLSQFWRKGYNREVGDGGAYRQHQFD